MDFLAASDVWQQVIGNEVVQTLLKNVWGPLIPRVVVILVTFLVLVFFIGYLVPSWWRIRRRLKAVIPRIQALKPNDGDPPVDRHAVQEILAVDQTFKHLWAEYSETLHEQCDYVEGERRLISIRATVPAEVFFNTQVLVDTPLNTEFFRHLPGILTGIGIIGTFSGLIAGLSGFEPTGSAEVVKASLSGLMEGVKEAFYASAFAIAAAMIITFVEKFGLNRRYKQVEQLAQAIDALYEAGAGEEYLARLVKASEESASQTKQLKQSLVTELKDILTELTQRQIQANKDHGLELSNNLAQSIRASLEGPLQRIADVVQTASGEQGNNVQTMLQQLVEQFKTKMDETFGGQMTGLNTLLTDSVVAMREMQVQFGTLVANLDKAGQDTSEKISSKLTEMLVQTEARQQALEGRMGQFLDEIRKNMDATQSETQQRLNAMVEALHGQTQKLIETFEGQRQASADQERARTDNLNNSTNEFVDGLKSGVGSLVNEVNKAVVAMGASIGQMKDGAETLYLASSEFKDAGKAVTGVMLAGQTTMSALQATSEQVRQAAVSLSGQLADYQQARSAMTQMTVALQGLIESAKMEAGINHQLVSDMQKTANSMDEVGRQTQEYLGEVSKILNTAFTSFGENVKRSMESSNAAFNSELDKSVKILSNVVHDLDAFMAERQ